MPMIDEPYANSTAIERLESLLYGLKALDQHVQDEDMDHAGLVAHILRSELEQLITDCRTNDTRGGYVSSFGRDSGVHVLRLRFSLPGAE